jgi:hypothetical protein
MKIKAGAVEKGAASSQGSCSNSTKKIRALYCIYNTEKTMPKKDNDHRFSEINI